MTTTSPVWVGMDIGSTELVLHHLPVGDYNNAPGRNFNQAPIDSS